MRAGKLSIRVISDGSFLLDGGALFGQVPKVIWEQKSKADRKNRVRLGLNCLLIQNGEKNILVDTGIGSKEPENLKEIYGLKCNKLITSLRALGLSVRQIDMVILTHLHFDHAGGATKIDRTGRATPTFPKAKYIIQKSCWEEASKPNERTRASFHPEDFVPLKEKEQMVLIDGDSEIAPGVEIRVTNGHMNGHQAVIVNTGGEKIAFAGDLIPTPYHVPIPYISAVDSYPEVTLQKKKEFLEQAIKEGWLLVFSHGFEQRAGYVESKNGKLQLRSIEI